MRTLQGVSRRGGVAMAVVVVVEAQRGLSGLPEEIIREGLKAIRMGLPETDQPEVIIACDMLSVGSMIRIPGVRTIGIISEANDQPGLPINVPCIAGVTDLLSSVDSADFAILDGNEGVVHLCPDVQTMVRYQHALSQEPTERVFLESSHIPAHTQDGRVVAVAGVVASINEAEIAIAQGADALVVRFARLLEDECSPTGSAFQEAEVEYLEMLYAMSAGKPLVIVLTDPSERLQDMSTKLDSHGRINIVAPEDAPKSMSDEEVRSAVCSGVTQVAVRAEAVARVKDLIRMLPEEDESAVD